MSEALWVAIITGGLALLGNFLANNKNAALIAYRLEQLEKKVNMHNSVIERTYRLEQDTAVQTEQIKVINHRLEDLESIPGG